MYHTFHYMLITNAEVRYHRERCIKLDANKMSSEKHIVTKERVSKEFSEAKMKLGATDKK